MKNKSFLSIEKNMIKGEQTLYYNYKKLLFQKSFDEEYNDVQKN